MTGVPEPDDLIALIAETRQAVARARELRVQVQIEREALQVVIEQSRGLMGRTPEGRRILILARSNPAGKIADLAVRCSEPPIEIRSLSAP